MLVRQDSNGEPNVRRQGHIVFFDASDEERRRIATCLALLADSTRDVAQIARLEGMLQENYTRGAAALLWRLTGHAASVLSEKTGVPFLPNTLGRSAFREASSLRRSMEGRPYFADSQSDISVSGSGAVMAISFANGFRRIGVDIEEVSVDVRDLPRKELGEFRAFLELRVRRMLPNFVLCELWWLLSSLTEGSAPGCSCSVSVAPDGSDPGPQPPSFSPVVPHRSVAEALASSYFQHTLDRIRATRCASCYAHALEMLQRKLYLLWTIKEGYVKALGLGIPFGMARIAVHLESWRDVEQRLLRLARDDQPSHAVDSMLFPSEGGRSCSSSACSSWSYQEGLYVDGELLVQCQVTLFSSRTPTAGVVGSLVELPSTDPRLVEPVRATPPSAVSSLSQRRAPVSMWSSSAARFIDDVVRVSQVDDDEYRSTGSRQ